MGLRKTVFGRQKAKVNTYIGGVASVLNTPSALATALSISVNRIKLFSIIGSDIQCAIIGGTYIVQNTFYSGIQGLIKYYKDADGIVSGIGSQAFYNTAVEEVYMPNATYVADTSFDQNIAFYNRLRKLYIPRALTIGSSVLNNNVFRSGNLGGGVIYVHPSLQTINSGGVEGDIAYLSTGNTIRYVTNFTAPNSISDLSAGTIYNTAIQLNFTPPSGTNSVEFYEVWVDGVFKNNITTSGKYVYGLTANMNYNVVVYAIDIFYNKSLASNVLNVTTTNYLSDTDASAYITASSNVTYQYGIHDLYKMLKDYSLYSKIQAFYLNIGTSSQQKYNGNNPMDTDGAFRQTYSGGATFSDLGYAPNGSTGYANTHFIPSANQALNSNGFTIAIGTNNSTPTADTYDMGTQNSATQSSILSSKVSNGNLAAFRMQSSYVTAPTNSDSRGIFTGVKQSSTVSKLFKNNALIGSGTGGGTLPTLNIFIGAINLSSSPYGFSTQRIQSVWIHEGLTDAEVDIFHNIISAFEINIGRKTW